MRDRHYNISNCGDHAVTIEMGETMDISTHRDVMALFHQLLNSNISGVKDIIPAYTTITVVYDIMEVKRFTDDVAHSFIKKEIEKEISKYDWKNDSSASEITIPVCYDVSLGIDLTEMSRKKSLSVERIIHLHASRLYDVYMIGFLPGFAYMGIVDDKIATPRLSRPRINVPAGSVGIAGNQTGIYPLDSPGGWNIIGQTPLRIFDANKEEPCLLKPGDKIKFVAISLSEFNQQKNFHEHHYL
jgi:inhibitor of KinA